MQQEMKSDFFITYHHDDELAARWIADIILKVPFSLFMESWDFLPGSQPREKIDYMLSRSRSAVVLVSKRWLRAGIEIDSWQPVSHKYPGQGFPSLLLLRIDSCDVPRALGGVSFTDLYGIKAGEAASRLLKATGAAALEEEKKETFPVTPATGLALLELQKKELDRLLAQTIKHQYHMTLDLETEVEKEVEVEDKNTGRIEKLKQWVWEAVPMERILTDQNHYLLVNPSGMGKTTFLTYAAGVQLDRAKDYPFVPLFTTCIAVNQRSGSITDFIAGQVESLYKNAQTRVVKEDWENLCILIDALDQARDVDDIVSSFLLPNRYTHYKKAKIILSSRQNTADKVREGFRKIRLKLPVDDEIRLYLGDENYTKLEGHIQASRELVTVPVLLEMLKAITAKGVDATILENRADLYTEFTKILVDQERSKPRFWQDSAAVHHFIENELEQTLEKIAFFSLAENKILEIEKEILVKYCGAPEKKEALLNIGILLELFEDREQKVVFRHQSFQAYFAARYMYYRRPDLFREITGDICFFYSDIWYEVMRFFVGLEKDPQKAEKVIDSIYKLKDSTKSSLNNTLRLIFTFFLSTEMKLSKEKSLELNARIRDLLTIREGSLNFIISNIDKFNQFNTIQWNNFTDTFEFLLRNKSKDAQGAATTLNCFKSSNGINLGISLLKIMLRDNDFFIRNDAVSALGDLGTAKDIPLMESLLDNNAFYRSNVKNALARIHTRLNLSDNEDFDNLPSKNLKDVETEHSAKIDTVKVITRLKPMLRDKNFHLRHVAVKMLEKIGTSEHVPLLPFLRDKKFRLRRLAVRVLGKIGTEKNAIILKSMLRKKNEWDRNEAAEALGKIGTKKHIRLLEPLLMEERRGGRRIAVRAIEKIYKRSAAKLRVNIPESLVEKKARETVIFQLQSLITPRIPPIHILHISDIHYSAENDSSITRIFHEFLKDIEKWREQHHNEPIHVICITGDVAFSGQKDQYASIHERINEILEVSGCPKDNLFLIPGNHDVHEYNNIPEECERIMDEAVKDENCIERILSDFEKYRPFHDKFTHYYGYVETSGFTNSRPETRSGNPKPWYSRRLKDFPVRIIGLNSALFCLKPYSERDKIRMEKRQLEEAYFHETHRDTEEQELVLLLTHHPADWLRETEKDEYTALMDSFSVVHLHGHTHKLKIKEVRSLSGSTYMLIGTGSIYGEKGTNHINTYHIMTLDFDKRDIHIWGRRWEPGYGFWTVFADNNRNVFPFPQKKS
jgi:HEAT repeat protein/predicted phosphodiesterase